MIGVTAMNALAKVHELSKLNKKQKHALLMKDAVIEQQSRIILDMRRDLDRANVALAINETLVTTDLLPQRGK